MANFAVHWNHETTVASQLEFLPSFCKRFLQHCTTFVYASESSVQRTTQTIFIVTLTLLTTGCSNLPSPAPSGAKFNGHVFTAAPVNKFIFTHSTASDYSWHQDQNFQVKMSLVSCRKFHPNMPSNRTPVIIPFIATPAIITRRLSV